MPSGSLMQWSNGVSRSHSNSSSSRDPDSDPGFSEDNNQGQGQQSSGVTKVTNGSTTVLPPPPDSSKQTANSSLTARLRCVRRRSTFAGDWRYRRVQNSGLKFFVFYFPYSCETNWSCHLFILWFFANRVAWVILKAFRLKRNRKKNNFSNFVDDPVISYWIFQAENAPVRSSW